MNNFEPSGFEASIYIFLIFIMLLAFIVVLRHYFNKVKFKRKRGNRKTLSERTKYGAVNVYKYSSVFFRFGLFISLTIVFLAFSTTTKKEITPLSPAYNDQIEQIIQVPITYQKVKPKLNIPRIIVEIPEELLVDEEVEFQTMDIDADTEVHVVIEETIDKNIVEMPLTPPTKDIEEDLPFLIVEQAPRFPGCEVSGLSNKERETCAQKKLFQYIYSKLKYPAIARENGVEGMVVIRFVVNESGSVLQVEILRDIGAGCGEAAAKVVREMNNLSDKWTPGKQRGRAVKVLYTLPVKFKLEG